MRGFEFSGELAQVIDPVNDRDSFEPFVSQDPISTGVLFAGVLETF